MSDLTADPQEPASEESDLEVLARQSDLPVETVSRIYELERAKLDKAARIKTYVPVLAQRHVKELLQLRRAV